MAKDKAETVSFKRRDLLADSRKRYKDLLDFSPFQVVIEISYETYVKNEKPLQKAGEKAIDAAEKDVNAKVAALAGKIEDLQQEEQKGNDKAATKANDELKKVNGDIKDLLADLNADVREAVEAAIKSESGEKEKLKSIGRNTCKGVKIKKGIFTGAANLEAIEDFGDAVDKLAKHAEVLLKQAGQEDKLRTTLVTALMECLAKIKEWTPKLNYKQIVKDNAKLFRSAESATKEYDDLLDDCGETADLAADTVKSLSKLQRSEKELSEQKKEVGDYEKAVESFAGRLKELEKASKKAVDAVDGDTSDKDARQALKALKDEGDLRKPAKAVNDAGKKLAAQKKKL